MFTKLTKNIFYYTAILFFIQHSHISVASDGAKDVNYYQDTVLYDNFLYKDGQKKLTANQNAESGKYWGSWVTKRGKLYIIDNDMKLTKNVNWGNDITPVISTSWSNTSISIVVIKHPQNKPIVIEGTKKQTITLGKGIILDIQSPVTFKNVRIHRAPDGSNSSIYKFGTKKVCQLGSYGLYSSAVIVRAPVKFENCIFSTSNKSGIWSDVHCTTPGNSTMEFYNNTYQIKHIYINSNTKGSTVPIFKTNEKAKIQPILSAISGDRNNIAITSSMLSDFDNGSNIDYIPVGNFNKSNGTVLYIVSSAPNCMKDKNSIWFGKTDNTNDIADIKQKCLKFLQKSCTYPTDKNDVNIEMYKTSLNYVKTIDQLISEEGYIDTDMNEEGEKTFPTIDWNRTVKQGILPLSTTLSTVNINAGLIGKQSLKIQSPSTVHELRINGDWSQYSGTITLPKSISKLYVSGKDIPFGIVASQNFEIDVVSPRTKELYITRDLSQCKGTVSFGNNIAKISFAMDKPGFSIGGTSILTIGTTTPEITTMTFKPGILNRKGIVLIDTNVKTVSIE